MVFEACTARAVAGNQGEKVLNTEVDTEMPREVHTGGAEAAAGGGLEVGVPAGDAEAVAGDELGGGNVDEGVMNDSETFTCPPCDPEGAEHKVSPDPGEPTASQVEDHRACGHWPVPGVLQWTRWL